MSADRIVSGSGYRLGALLHFAGAHAASVMAAADATDLELYFIIAGSQAAFR